MLLSREQLDRFQDLYGAFFRYVNQQLSIVEPLECAEKMAGWSAETKIKIRTAWIDDPSLLDKYLSETASQLSADDHAQVAAWKHFKVGNFVVFRQLKKHAILLAEQDGPVAYAVFAHQAVFEDVARAKLPVMISTLLLPFDGLITFDGTLTCPGISFGPDAAKSLNESFRRAKASQGIVTRLDNAAESHDPVRPDLALDAADTIYQIKITLRGTRPPIWRTIQVRDGSLAQLHDCIQVAMGWQDRQRHLFSIHGQRYSTPNLLTATSALSDLNANDYRLSDFATEEKVKFGYLYDFRNSWEHLLVVEKILTAKPGTVYPLCLKGKLASPPESVAGVSGFYDYVEAVSDPEHYQYKDMIERIGAFDPSAFDPNKMTEQLQVAVQQEENGVAF